MSKISVSNTDDETTINRVCPSCGFNNSQRGKFCIECGTLLLHLASVNQPQILDPLFQNSKPLEFEADQFTPLPPKPNPRVRDSPRAVSFSGKPGFCRGSAPVPTLYPPHPRFAGVSGIGATTGGLGQPRGDWGNHGGIGATTGGLGQPRGDWGNHGGIGATTGGLPLQRMKQPWV